MEYKSSGNLDNTPPSVPDTDTWKHIDIKAQSLDEFTWTIVCDERWEDPKKAAYKCHRLTRKAKALGGYLYAVATHISPSNRALSPSVSESLIFVPLDDAAEHK